MSQLVYFSSSSENTQRFIERLGLPAVRIPLNERERIQVDEPYILIVPSYGGGGTAGAVPRQVIRFLNDEHNRALLRGVIASGAGFQLDCRLPGNSASGYSSFAGFWQ